MQKPTKILLSALLGCFATPLAISAQQYMEPATISFPYTTTVSVIPSAVDITWDNQPIQLINPVVNDYGEEVVYVKVVYGDVAPQEVSAALYYSEAYFDDEEDVWSLQIGLYELEDLFDFDGDSFSIEVPAGIVKNPAGDLNPAQTFTFNIVSTYPDYTLSLDSGSSIEQKEAIIKISFGDNPITYNEGEVTIYDYTDGYDSYGFEYGEEVTISGNELILNLTSLKPDAVEYYEVVIPEGFVNIDVDGDTYINPDMWLEYTILPYTGSVESLIQVNSVSPVFNLQGVKVGNSSNLDNLNKGIYIQNGKKVIVK